MRKKRGRGYLKVPTRRGDKKSPKKGGKKVAFKNRKKWFLNEGFPRKKKRSLKSSLRARKKKTSSA